MGFFRKSSSNDTGASDYERRASDYDHQINEFLQQVEHSKNRSRSDPLERLLKWGHHMIEKKKLADAQSAEQTKIHRKDKQDIEELTHALNLTKADLHNAKAHSRTLEEKHSDEVTRLTVMHSNDMEQHKRQLDRQVENLNKGHASKIEQLKRRYDSDLTSQRKEQRAQQEQHKKVLETSNNIHNIETNKLRGQLVANQKEGQAWSDDILETKFRNLKVLVDAVTAPSNKELLFPPNQLPGRHLDPSQFIERAGRGKSHFFLRNKIWSVLIEQYFSAPFGFGCLGPGSSQRTLAGVYYAWRDLLKEEGPQKAFDFNGPDEYGVFYKSVLANDWRSSTFQCISGTLSASARPSGQLTILSDANNNTTVSRILAILQEVSSLSNAMLRPDIKSDVSRIAKMAAAIAIQFGVHPARLELLEASRRENIKIGSDFHDCEDGDIEKGASYQIDMIVAPGLRKVGNGRADLTVRRTVIPCEIYPLED